VWENYLFVAADCGAIQEAIRAIGRILDIKNEFDDHEILKLLVMAVTDDTVHDVDERPAVIHRAKVVL